MVICYVQIITIILITKFGHALIVKEPNLHQNVKYIKIVEVCACTIDWRVTKVPTRSIVFSLCSSGGMCMCDLL